MKIIQVISYFYPAWSYGGPGKLVFNLSECMAKGQNSISVFSTDAFDAVRRRNNTDNINLKKNARIKYFFSPNLSNRIAFNSKIFLTCMNFIILIKEIKKCDVIHLHEFFTPLAVVVSFLAKRFDKPFFISAHGTLDNFHISHRSQLKKIFMRIAGSRMLKNSTGLIAATIYEIKEYEKLGIPSDKIKLVKNGIDYSEFKKLPAKGLFRKKYHIAQNAKILIFLGRINKLKGLDMLIDAFDRLLKHIEARLIIAGSDDGYLDQIRARVSQLNLNKKVLFPGILAGSEKLEAFADSDLFVYPSPAEGFSIAILEAAASRLPLLITQGCKFPEVAKFRAGMITPYDPELFYLKMRKMLQDEFFRNKLAENARKLIRESYTIEVMTHKLIGIYNKI